MKTLDFFSIDQRVPFIEMTGLLEVRKHSFTHLFFADFLYLSLISPGGILLRVKRSGEAAMNAGGAQRSGFLVSKPKMTGGGGGGGPQARSAAKNHG